jgi:hypothetical protein
VEDQTLTSEALVDSVIGILEASAIEAALETMAEDSVEAAVETMMEAEECIVHSLQNHKPVSMHKVKADMEEWADVTLAVTGEDVVMEDAEDLNTVVSVIDVEASVTEASEVEVSAIEVSAIEVVDSVIEVLETLIDSEVEDFQE